MKFKLGYIRRDKNGKVNGLRSVWNEDEKGVRQAPFRDGKRDGHTTEWYKSGAKKVKHNIKMPKTHEINFADGNEQ